MIYKTVYLECHKSSLKNKICILLGILSKKKLIKNE